MKPRILILMVLLAAGIFTLFPLNPIWAQTGAPSRAARLSYVEGEVAVQRPDVQAWAEAPVNTPLQEGFKLSTGENSFAEVQFENGSTVRVGQLSLLNFTTLALGPSGARITELELVQGYATFHPLPSSMGDTLSVSTAYAALTAPGGTLFRVDLDEGMERVEVFNGEVQVQSNLGDVSVATDSVLVLQPGATDPKIVSMGITNDDWDQWVADRESQTEISPSAPEPNSYAGNMEDAGYGWSDLQQNGSWGYVIGVGYGWTPRVHDRWAPYSAGQWCWYPGWGYTWIGAEPWGWLPYHYGSWDFIAGRGWVWFPGSLRNWSASRVDWYQGPGWVGWTPRHHRVGGNIACGNNCGGGVVSTTTFRNGGGLNSHLMLGVNPASGNKINDPGFAPTTATMLPGRTVSLPASQSSHLRGRPVNPVSGARPGHALPPTIGPRRPGGAPPNSNIVYDPEQNRYINSRRTAPPQTPQGPTEVQNAPHPQAPNPGVMQPVPIENRDPAGRENQDQFRPDPTIGGRPSRPVPVSGRGNTNFYTPPQSRENPSTRPDGPRPGALPAGTATQTGGGGAVEGGRPATGPGNWQSADRPVGAGHSGGPPASGGRMGGPQAGEAHGGAQPASGGHGGGSSAGGGHSAPASSGGGNSSGQRH